MRPARTHPRDMCIYLHEYANAAEWAIHQYATNTRGDIGHFITMNLILFLMVCLLGVWSPEWQSLDWLWWPKTSHEGISLDNKYMWWSCDRCVWINYQGKHASVAIDSVGMVIVCREEHVQAWWEGKDFSPGIKETREQNVSTFAETRQPSASKKICFVFRRYSSLMLPTC